MNENLKEPISCNFCFSTKIKVGIRDINYANHLGHDRAISFLHEARISLLYSIGLSELDNDGFGIMILNLNVDYKNQAFFGDELEILTAYIYESPLTFRLFYEMKNVSNNKKILTATTQQIFYDYKNKKVSKPPEKILSSLKSLKELHVK